MKIPLNKLKLGTNIREVSREVIEALKKSISLLGQLQPLIIDANCTVIAGEHRFLALQELGVEEVDVVISQNDEETNKLIQISENLIRKELSVSEKADHTIEYMNLCTSVININYNKHGGLRQKGQTLNGVSPVKYTAQALSVSESTIRQYRQITSIKSLVPKEIQAQLTKTQLLFLVRLANTPGGRQDVEDIVISLNNGDTFEDACNVELDQAILDTTCLEDIKSVIKIIIDNIIDIKQLLIIKDYLEDL